MNRRSLVICLLGFFAMGAPGFSQPPIPPPGSKLNTRAAIQGFDTVRGYRLSLDAREVIDPAGQVLMLLPLLTGMPVLMGMLQQDSDLELFLSLDDRSPEGPVHKLEIFRGRRGAEAVLVHAFTLDDPWTRVRFFQPPDSRDNPAVLLDVYLGNISVETYLLAPDRKSIDKLYDTKGGNGEFIDLDGDGVYELVNRDAQNPRCRFLHYYGPGVDPEIFVRAGAGYRKAWPPPDWAPADFLGPNQISGAKVQDDATFADLRGDGTDELIVLQDRLAEEPAQVLAVYRLENKSFRLVAETPLPPQQIAFLLETRDSPGGKQILVRTATPSECTMVGAEQRGTVKAYQLRGDKLESVEP